MCFGMITFKENSYENVIKVFENAKSTYMYSQEDD